MKNRIRGGVNSKHKRQPHEMRKPQLFRVTVERLKVNGDISNWYMYGKGITEYIPIGSKLGAQFKEELGAKMGGDFLLCKNHRGTWTVYEYLCSDQT